MEGVGLTMVEGNIPLRMVDTMPVAAAHLIVVGNMHRRLVATVMDAISDVEWITSAKNCNAKPLLGLGLVLVPSAIVQNRCLENGSNVVFETVTTANTQARPSLVLTH